MKKTAYRICRSEFVSTAFDGEGARVNGGRWNSVGTRMVYTASSVSLATLEILVHTEDISIIYGRYTVIPIEFDAGLVQAISRVALPRGWNAPQVIAATQILGDKWVKSMSSVLLEVPSAVTENESNFLISPAHPDFTKIAVGKSFVFKPDPRLKGS